MNYLILWGYLQRAYRRGRDRRAYLQHSYVYENRGSGFNEGFLQGRIQLFRVIVDIVVNELLMY